MTTAHDPDWRWRWRGRHGWTSPPPDPPGAEDAELIFVGYRTWRASLEPLRLRSMHDGSEWPPGEPMQARGTSLGAGLYCHTSLGNCTAYAAFSSDRATGAYVHGAVALWGNVRGGAGGERRADFAYPLSLDIAVGLDDFERRALREVYGLAALPS